MSISSVVNVNNIFNQIQVQLEKEQQKLDNKKAMDAKQAKIDVQGFEKTVNKSSLNSAALATDIGVLVKDQSRLNGYGALKKNDSADYLSFKVVTGGETKFGAVADEGVRFRILTRSGVEVANSDPKSKTFENWKNLANGEQKLSVGEYRIEITKDRNIKSDKDALNYAVQVSQGVYRKDYDTIVKQPKAGEIVPGLSLSQTTVNLSNMLLSQSYASGTSGSQKLMSFLGS